MVRILSRPKPRTSMKSLSIGGQRPSRAPAPMRDTSTTSSATSPWPRLMSSRPSSLLPTPDSPRSEEHTSELQSQSNLVCRLLLEKKKQIKRMIYIVNVYENTYLHD